MGYKCKYYLTYKRLLNYWICGRIGFKLTDLDFNFRIEKKRIIVVWDSLHKYELTVLYKVGQVYTIYLFWDLSIALENFTYIQTKWYLLLYTKYLALCIIWFKFQTNK